MTLFSGIGLALVAAVKGKHVTDNNWARLPRMLSSYRI